MELFAIMLGLSAPFLIGAGIWLRVNPPKKINWVVGYRTRRAMADQARWDFAQVRSGGVLIRCGIALLAFGAAALLLEPAHELIEAGLGLAAIVGVCTWSFRVTERALIERFGKDGQGQQISSLIRLRQQKSSRPNELRREPFRP